MNVAQRYHSIEYHLKSKFTDQKTQMKRLSDLTAVELGADFLSEAFIFTVAGTVVGTFF